MFLDPDNVPSAQKINFNLRLSLSCNASWVKTPGHLDMGYKTRHFMVSIDPTGLKPGAHATYIQAYDVSKPHKGHLFEIPITVIRADPVTQLPRPHVSYPSVTFPPGDIKRHFLFVPEKATWASIKFNSQETTRSGRFVVHTVQLLPRLVYKTNKLEKMFTIHDQGEYGCSFAVKGMKTSSARFLRNQFSEK